jgi:hypothetical protein
VNIYASVSCAVTSVLENVYNNFITYVLSNLLSMSIKCIAGRVFNYSIPTKNMAGDVIAVGHGFHKRACV